MYACRIPRLCRTVQYQIELPHLIQRYLNFETYIRVLTLSTDKQLSCKGKICIQVKMH